MTSDGSFVEDAKHAQRFSWRGIPIDIIPFGAIAGESSQITWPPDDGIGMNVAGFEDALTAAVRLQISGDLVAPVASIRLGNAETTRVERPARHYEQGCRFNPDLAAAHLLGEDAGKTCSDSTRRRIDEILGSENLIENLRVQMLGNRKYVPPDDDPAPGLLRAGTAGFQDAKTRRSSQRSVDGQLTADTK